MNTKHFPVIQKWIIPDMCFTESIKELSQDGRSGNEGIVLWLGRRRQENAFVTHIMLLRGMGVRKEPDLIQITASLFNEVTNQALTHNISLLGQVHSHGLNYGVDLSFTDKQNGISVPYYLSLVAPDYGMRRNLDLKEFGVHIFQPNEGFRRLAISEIHTRIEIAPSSISIITVGEE